MSSGSGRARAALSAVAVATLAAAGCWVAPGQGPNRSAFNALETSINVDTVATLHEEWTNTWAGTMRDPLSQGGIVFAPSGSFFSGGVRAIDMATGATLWQLPAPATTDEFAGAVLVDGGGAWLGTGNGRLDNMAPFRVDATTGVALQGRGELSGIPEALRGDTLALHGGIFQPFVDVPAISGDFVTVGGTDGSLSWTGFVDFSVSGEPPPAVLPLTLGPDFVYPATSGSLALAPGDMAFVAGMRAYPVGGPAAQNCGRPNFERLACPAWATPLDGTLVTPAVRSDDASLIYVATDAGTLYALDAATGAVAWTSALGAPVIAPPATVFGRLYVPTTDGRLVVLPAAGCGAPSCSALATGDAGSSIGVQPGVAGGVVFTGSSDGTVHAFPADCTGTCPVLWSAQAGGAITGAPAIDGGHLLVGTGNGRTVAYAPAP